MNPFLVPPDRTFENSAAPLVTLKLMVAALGAGAFILFPSIVTLFWIFKSGPKDLQKTTGE